MTYRAKNALPADSVLEVCRVQLSYVAPYQPFRREAHPSSEGV
jgi:hypothetical protein